MCEHAANSQHQHRCGKQCFLKVWPGTKTALFFCVEIQILSNDPLFHGERVHLSF